ncbi:MAG TPA: maltotransferase domain-containing protein [Thermoanaerobaculia bacterium]|nr:maltotransferase domain-containing protein [Thermoanaerobaculia bacterium]
MHQTEGRKRVIVERVLPELDAGRFPVKRVVGDELLVEADVFADGHDLLGAMLLYRREGETTWDEVRMLEGTNDRWRGSFSLETIGRYEYTVEGWVDHFQSWRRDLRKRLSAEQNVAVQLLIGLELLSAAIDRSPEPVCQLLSRFRDQVTASTDDAGRSALFLNARLAELADRAPDRALATRYARVLIVEVERTKARFSTWYELFPRSASPLAGKHGTFRDVERLLPRISRMGFDVLYLPPIHPIGRTFRKGKNNAPIAEEDDVGSPWAIGAAEGGHTAIHPELGTLNDFRRLLKSASSLNIEVAMDIAFQSSPDHPAVTRHPEWFRKLPDGSIQYAENPPKTYQDIYPFYFESEEWSPLWEELASVIRYWLEQGVSIFRIDNPHTKPLPFWEWLITVIRKEHPGVIFLAEAFTRPKIMNYLAKAGFSQSYTYFTWRNTKRELTSYFTELTTTELAEYFRPNAWPNTPDILPEHLQYGRRAMFMVRLLLAATLSSNYGIYGPSYELLDHEPRATGTEEYLNSEKYELRSWKLDSEDSLEEFIARVNRIRRENPALQRNETLLFHETDNEEVICFSKRDATGNVIVAAINLDVHNPQTATLHLPLEELGLETTQSYQVHDLLTGARFIWQGERNAVTLQPASLPARLFRIRRKMKSEHDFDYFA